MRFVEVFSILERAIATVTMESATLYRVNKLKSWFQLAAQDTGITCHILLLPHLHHKSLLTYQASVLPNDYRWHCQAALLLAA